MLGQLLRRDCDDGSGDGSNAGGKQRRN